MRVLAGSMAFKHYSAMLRAPQVHVLKAFCLHEVYVHIMPFFKLNYLEEWTVPSHFSLYIALLRCESLVGYVALELLSTVIDSGLWSLCDLCLCIYFHTGKAITII